MSVPISGGSSPAPNPLLVESSTGVQPAATTTDEPVIPPVGTYLKLPFSRNTFDTLGIALPRTPDDVTALLAEVSVALEQIEGELRNNRDAAIGSRMRSALSGLAGQIAHMAEVHAQAIQLEGEKDAKVKKRDEDVAARTSLQQQSDNLQTQIDGLNQYISSLDPKKDKDAINAATQQRDALIDQKSGIDSDIAKLTTRINKANEDISSLEKQVAAKNQEYLDTQAAILNIFAMESLFLNALEPFNALRDAERDFGVANLFEDIAQRLGSGRNPFDANFGALSFLDQIRLAPVVERIANAIGARLERNEITSLLASMSIGSSNRTTILGLVLEASIKNLTPDQLRDQNVRGRVMEAALGLVAGLADVVATLAALEAFTTFDASEALSDGLRMRLAV